MALEETIEYDKIEVVGEFAAVQVRKATIIKKDGVQVAKSYDRYVLQCGALKGGFKEDGTTPADDADDLVDTDISSEPAKVSAICNAVWTSDVKAAYKAMLIASKPTA